MNTVMTIAYDPKVSPEETPDNRYGYFNLREIPDEATSEEESDIQSAPRYLPEDWEKMYLGRKMEENY